jgi:thiol-disulfide isomerase/thioredoxin
MILRHSWSRCGLLASLILCVMSREASALDLGDPAPRIQINEWVKGNPVDFARGRGSNVFVVDFWSTICAPCRYTIPYLGEMQKKYRDRGVVVVGISSEPVEKVKREIPRLGVAMNYAMAVDAGNKTADAYLKGVGWQELPHAFVIDKDGKLVWHGNSTVALDQVLDEVLTGKLDIESARRTIAAEKAIQEYYRIAATGMTNSRLAELGDQIITNAAKYHSILNEFAWKILTERTVRTKDYKLALRAARAAYEMNGQIVPIMDTYARALFQTGHHAEAIEMEKKAIAACDDSHFRPELESVLLRFQRLSRANGKK